MIPNITLHVKKEKKKKSTSYPLRVYVHTSSHNIYISVTYKKNLHFYEHVIILKGEDEIDTFCYFPFVSYKPSPQKLTGEQIPPASLQQLQ